jgi:hypothetical protein
MSTSVVRAPQPSGIGAPVRISVAIALVALALVGAVLVFSSNDSPTVTGAAVRTDGGPDEATVGVSVSAGRAVFPAHPDEATTAAAVSGGSGEADDVPPGSGVSMGRTPYSVPEPNLLPK